MMNQIIKVLLPIALDKEFDYVLPAAMAAKAGSRVLVDLRGRRQVGIAMRYASVSSLTRLKSVIEVLDKQPLLSSDHLRFAKDLARLYPYPMAEFLFMMLPLYLRKARHYIPGQFRQTSPILKAFPETIFYKAEHFTQRYAMWRDRVREALERGSALILFPQVSYLNEAMPLLEKDFPGQLKVMHSRESEKKLFDIWQGSRTHALLVGTRFAVFYYPQDVRLIVVEEENSPYYFQEEKPYYHLLAVAQVLSRIKKAELILSADYPALATYTHIKNKLIVPSNDISQALSIAPKTDACPGLMNQSVLGYRAVTLYDNDRIKPPIRIVDIAHTEAVMSPVVIELLRADIAQQKRAAVLWNKKGFGSRIGCIACRHIFTCTNCSAALKPFLSEQKGICPYCSRLYDIPKRCPSCAVGYIRSYGVGTEKIMQILRRAFPDVSIESWECRKPETQIIIATSKLLSSLYRDENIAKGFVLDADARLCRADYDATFDTYLYVRSLTHFFREGLYVFTKNRQHYLFDLLNEDWPRFYEKELFVRRELSLPPCGVLATITIRARQEEALFKKATLLYNHIKEKGVEVYGPTKCEPFKLRGNFRYSLTVKSAQGAAIRSLVREEVNYARSLHVQLAAIIQ